LPKQQQQEVAGFRRISLIAVLADLSTNFRVGGSASDVNPKPKVFKKISTGISRLSSIFSVDSFVDCDVDVCGSVWRTWNYLFFRNDAVLACFPLFLSR
jgi:hypothetical protein